VLDERSIKDPRAENDGQRHCDIPLQFLIPASAPQSSHLVQKVPDHTSRPKSPRHT
jgi:hypothetical protein